jgi:ribosome assembly protein YihI (activator of Der GTPase)
MQENLRRINMLKDEVPVEDDDDDNDDDEGDYDQSKSFDN